MSGVLRCSRCRELKPREAFATRFRATARPDTFCRACRAEYGKEHYARNKQRYIDQAAARKRALADERTRFLIDYFVTHPCADCGETDPVVLEFDHLRDKAFNIGTGLLQHRWQTVLDEIAKCEVVCANCHRRRTARRRGSRRFRFGGGEAGDGN